jgi:hypothetical protein
MSSTRKRTQPVRPEQALDPPAELADKKQWVVWRLESRKGKETKVPYRARDGRNASTTRSADWCTFEQALEGRDRLGMYGIGFVFSKNDPYCGVDFDHCFVKGELHPDAKRYIDALGSYAERSPSGTGVHVIVRASLNGQGTRTGETPWGGNYEAYDQGRYFTFTGNVLNGLRAILDGQDAFDEQHSELVGSAHGAVEGDWLKKARKSDRFRLLYDEGVANDSGDGSHSAADFELIQLLIEYIGHASPRRVLLAFKASALYRGDAKAGDDYVLRTIENALKSHADEDEHVATEEAGREHHHSRLWIRRADIERVLPVRSVWRDRTLEGMLNLTVGEEGIGKGNLIAWKVARITNGELPGDHFGETGNVLVVGDEDSWYRVWVPRLYVAGADLSRVVNLDSGTSGVFDATKAKDYKALLEYIQDEDVLLVYFDQIFDNLGYTDSWKDQEVRNALAPLRRIADLSGCAMDLTMQPNKQGGTFRARVSGSAAFNALSRSSLVVARHPDMSDVIVACRAKGNYTQEPPGFGYRIHEETFESANGLIKTSRIEPYHGHGDMTVRADDLLEKPRSQASKSGLARSLLKEMFADGKPRKSSEVVAHLHNEFKIPRKTTEEARRKVGLQSWKDNEFQGATWWGKSPPE